MTDGPWPAGLHTSTGRAGDGDERGTHSLSKVASPLPSSLRLLRPPLFPQSMRSMPADEGALSLPLFRQRRRRPRGQRANASLCSSGWAEFDADCFFCRSVGDFNETSGSERFGSSLGLQVDSGICSIRGVDSKLYCNFCGEQRRCAYYERIG